MRRLTLTTDYGLSDFYVAALKGAIISRLPGVEVIDVTHDVRKYDTNHASYTIRRAYPYFPKNTVHFLDVGAGQNGVNSFYVVECEEHLFVFPNSDIGGRIFWDKAVKVWQIPFKGNNPFSFFLDDNLMAALSYLLQEGAPEQMGETVANPFDTMPLQPMQMGRFLTGFLEFTDGYGNLHSNIHRSQFEAFVQGRPFEIFFNDNVFDVIKRSVSEVIPGSNGALFDMHDFLTLIIHSREGHKLLHDGITNEIKVELK